MGHGHLADEHDIVVVKDSRSIVYEVIGPSVRGRVGGVWQVPPVRSSEANVYFTDKVAPSVGVTDPVIPWKQK